MYYVIEKDVEVIMRVSKPPEERKREMIDTAMKLFATKGYESTTMSDIARAMNVVPGLCYRYFRSKEDLYHEALTIYAQECSAPMIKIINGKYDSIDEYITAMQNLFRNTDGHEQYHDFFHREGNEIFHWQLEHVMLNIFKPVMTEMLEDMKSRNVINIEDCKNTAAFILHGEMPIINDDSLPTEKKIEIATKFIKKIINN